VSKFKVGDRVAVKPEYDELRKLAHIIPGSRTQPGVVVSIFEDDNYGPTYVVAEDSEDGPGGGSSAPYVEHELEASE
jgi:hypothetical protein